MPKHRAPRCKLMRREGTDLRLTSGLKPIAEKCNLEKTPGISTARSRPSDYGDQLRMKQMIRRYYGVSEGQFRRYFSEADRSKQATGNVLLRLLETRLDNVVYRLGFACTRAEARQLVSHKSILVNGRCVNIPSYKVSHGDLISIKPASKSQVRIAESLKIHEQNEPVVWLSCDAKQLQGELVNYPVETDFPSEFKVNLVVELYSK